MQIWNDYYTEHPVQWSLDHEGSGVHILRVWRDAPMPAELAVVTGEWFYSLRSALDYIIWATAVHLHGSIPPPSEGVLQYPIYDTEKMWNSQLHRLKPLADHHREMLYEMQPFASDSDANYLGWINRLSRIDRHRRLSVMTSYLADLRPVLQYPEGCNVEMRWGNRVLGPGKTEVLRLDLSPWDDSMEVKINPRSIIDPEIEDWSASPFWRRITYGERFAYMQIFVMGEVATYEYDCTGDTRKPDMLTDGFKEVSNARRQPMPVIVEPSTPTVWGNPVQGKPSTKHAFDGGRSQT
ncbi:hypothetical protein SAMN05443575_1461 [Jatrophihabitans endophyticus]|uniref:Uncharacterized protein n=2 Tax=Jatrophihabitans endophyticus TaxID=1206085 RepID=A0A1M5HBK8_9ACTN|nr:hypothetical protein SAMN05443575_1461 [Jatrophihabitans endophyticus]